MRPVADARGGAKSKRKPADPAARARAEQLAQNGMPMQMAMAVAHGKLSLNDALQRMAQREQVNKLMEKHALSRALATQIVLGQASMDVVQATRRLEDHRVRFRDRSILQERLESGVPVVVHLHGHKRVTGKIALLDSYMVRIEGEDGQIHDLHKLQCKLAYDVDATKRVRKNLKTDKHLAAEPREPIAKPQDRYMCSDRRLFGYMDAGTEVVAKSLEGEVLRGNVTWFSRFEFGLGLKGEAEVVMFRHALADVAPAR